MRVSPPAIAVALIMSTVSSVGLSRADANAVNPRSAALVEAGSAAQAIGKLDEATGLFETALAVDPGNRTAYVRLAQIAYAQKLNGKAIRLYNIALAMDPRDVVALAGQGEALASKGAIQRARDNLARVKLLCSGRCDSGDRLARVIDQASIEPVRSASAIQPEPVVIQEKP